MATDPSRVAVACLGAILCCSAAAAQAPAIAIQLGATELYLGDTLTVDLALDGAGESADVYLALLLPDGGLLTYGGANQPAAPGEIVALATGVVLAAAVLPALNQPLAVPIQEGSYFLLAALAPSGVSIFEQQLAISAPAAFSFTVRRPLQARAGLWRGDFEGLVAAALEFRVAEAGTQIESGARASELAFTCTGGCSGTLNETILASTALITDLTFAVSDPVFGSWQGQFDSATAAAGTYTLSGDLGSPCGICTVGELTWTAAWVEP